MLLMALPNEHLMTFNQYKEAKTLFAVIQTRFGGNEPTKKTQKTLLKQTYENFSATSTESLDSIFNRLQKIVSQLAILVSTANLSDDTVYAFLASQPNGSQIVYEDLEQIHEDDIEEMDLKWQLALPSMRTRRFFQKTDRKITINGSDTVGYDKSKVECFNCHKMGHFARECRGPRNQDNRKRNQDSSRRTVNVEEISSKAMVAIDGAGFDYSYMADDEVPTNISLIAFSDSEQLVVLKRAISYKDSEISMLKNELEKLKQEKESNQLIIENFNNASKSLDKLIGSRIPDKSRKGVGFVSYNAIPPPPTGLFSPPKFDLSNSGLEEFQQPEFEGYGPKPSKSFSEDTSNEVRKFPDASLVGELVSDDKLEKKTIFPTVAKMDVGHQQKEDQGYVDSGYSRHMTGNMSYLSDFKEFDEGYVTFGGGAKGGKITSKGTLKTADESQVLLKVPRKNNMYSVDMKNIVSKESLSCLVAKVTLNESMLWHRRLGYVNFKTINKLVKENIVRGLPSKCFENDQTCVACLKRKQHKASCKSKIQNSITQPLFMLHMDLFGPTFVSSLMNKKYCLVVTDVYSKFTWVFFLATKDETIGIFKSFITDIENLVDKKVKIIRYDNGTKFKNKVMSEFCELKGIKREFSVARTPQQNGVAERRNRTLIEVARTMLADSKLPTTFWAEAVNTACYVQNRVLVVKPHNKTPYELFRGRTLALSFMRPFGCYVTILNTLDYLGKFDGKSDEGFFVGYSLNSKGFRVYNIRIRKVEENLHIRFLEYKPIIVGDGPKWLFDIDVLTKSMNYVPVIAGINSNDLVDGSLFDSYLKNASNDEPQPSSDAGKKDDEGVCKENGITDQEKSKNSTQGVNTARPSINTEADMFSLGDNATLEATHADFFGDETKVDMSNITTTYPVSSTPNTRIHKDHSLDHVIGDVQSGVLKRRMTKTTNKQRFISDVYEGKTHEDLHTCLFACFLSQEEPKKVWTLVDLPHGKRPIGTKWVYKNKKDERSIVIRNKARMVAQGYTQEERIDYDEVFAPVARIEAIRLFLAYASFKDFVVYQLDIKSAFLYGKIKEEVYVYQPLGFEDPKFPDRVYKVEKALYGLHQAPKAWYETLSTYLLDNGFQRDKYVDEILKKFSFSTVKTTSTPMEILKPLLKDAEAEDVNVHLYRLMIGSLMYLTSLRPDIMFADSQFDLKAYSDSDYAGASLDRKSTTGEYVAAASCRQVLWIRNQMLDYGYNFMNTKIFIDNESTICIVKNPVFHSKTKHIEIRHHFIRDSNEKKLIQMIKIHTDQNVADLLTKAFDVGIFQYLIASIGILNL
ncbi:putative ribonuclease H-like domain-containing protein [Tanacetum coccineum]